MRSMAKKPQLPKTREELDGREVAGLWRAIGLTKEIAESAERITLSTIQRIHRTIFEQSEPHVAGRFRVPGEDVEKLKHIQPPPGSKVQERIYAFWQDFDGRISVLPTRCKNPKSRTSYKKWFAQVLDLAVWTQHAFVAVHPFPEGNGRMARLLTNLVLERYGIKPSQVKYEGEMKGRYLEALGQADRFADYEPLKKLVLQDINIAYQKEKKMRARLMASKRSR